MSSGWIGLRDRTGGMFAPAGPGSTAAVAVDPDTVLPRGTVMAEFRTDPGVGTRNLIRLAARDPWPVGLTLCIDAAGTLRLMQTQGQSHRDWHLPTDLTRPDETAIVTFCWDGPARRGRLTLYVPDRQVLHCLELDAPLPLSLRDAERLTGPGDLCRQSDRVLWLAVADRLIPAGPMPTLGADALIATPRGSRPIATLRAGDSVLTESGESAQIRWAGAVDLPARGHFAPVVLRAPWFDLSHDLVVSPAARLLLTGSDLDYLFGHERVSVRAHHLVDGRTVRMRAAAPVMRYHHLVLDDHAVFRANGAAIESLDIAPLLAEPAALAASVVGAMPRELLPRGPSLQHPVLREFEATTWRRMRAA